MLLDRILCRMGLHDWTVTTGERGSLLERCRVEGAERPLLDPHA